MTAPALDRATAGDLLESRITSGPAEANVGAVLVFAPGTDLDLDVVRSVLAEMIPAVPRLRRHLTPTPPGCGRPVWVDAVDFVLSDHVGAAGCPAPGTERALLDFAAALLVQPLPAARPPWRATLVTGLAGRRCALVLVFHHALADGIGGLAVLGALADGQRPPALGQSPLPPPTVARLAADAWRGRLRALRALPHGLRLGVAAVAELRHGLPRAPRTSLNRPTGPDRRLALARADLAVLRTLAHRHGATVNDVALTAVTGAVRAYLEERGEHLGRLVVSVPVSRHSPGEASPVHNAVAAVPVALPTTGPDLERLAAIARRSVALRSGPGPAALLALGPLFAALARLGAVRRYITTQARVNTWVSNLRGPSQQLRLAGATVTELLPLHTTAGNVGVAFGLLSYAGGVVMTVVGDPQVCPDIDGLARRLQQRLDDLARSATDAPVAG